MKSSICRAAIAAAGLAVTSLLSTHALARPSIKEPISGQGIHIYYDLATNTQSLVPPPPSGTNIFVNDTGTPDWALSSADPNGAKIGDVAEGVAGGRLHESDFTVYNGAASTTPLLSASVSVNFYAQNILNIAPGQPSSPLIGNFSVNLVWPVALDPGFYSTITLLNMDSLGLNVPANNRMLEFTQVTSHIGAERLGFVEYDSPTLGTDHQSMYYGDNTNPAGFYLFDNPQTQNNPGFRWNVAAAPEPASISILGLFGLTALARRRR